MLVVTNRIWHYYNMATLCTALPHNRCDKLLQRKLIRPWRIAMEPGRIWQQTHARLRDSS